MIDPTKSEALVIELAYQAQQFTLSQESFRRGQQQRKTYNPIHNAPTINRVITHLEGVQDFDWARKRARQLFLDPAAANFVNTMTTVTELRQFLATLSLFLKTTPTKGKKGMRAYTEPKQPPSRLDTAALIHLAWQITKEIAWQPGFNRNKITQLAGRLRGAQSHWECLAVLAQYYPLRGVPQPLIDRLVAELEKLDLFSFQLLANQVLIFYKAEEGKTKRQADKRKEG